MPVTLQPGMKVVGNCDKIEAGFLGPPGVLDQRLRTVFLAHELIAESNHFVPFPQVRCLKFAARRSTCCEICGPGNHRVAKPALWSVEDLEHLHFQTALVEDLEVITLCSEDDGDDGIVAPLAVHQHFGAERYYFE